MEELIRITYVSRSTFKPFKQKAGIEPNVARILSESRRNNTQRNLVGVLYYGDGCFFQCLEGEAQDIDELLESLKRDSRHGELEILSRSVIEQLSFYDWNMKYVAVDEQVKDLLKQQGLSRFDPYQFSPELIRQMVDVFHQMPEPVSPSDVEEHARLVDVIAPTQQPSTQQWDRMIKVVAAALALVVTLIGLGALLR